MVLYNSSKEILLLSNLFTDQVIPLPQSIKELAILSSLIVKNSPTYKTFAFAKDKIKMKYETRSVGWWIRSKPWLAPNLTLWPSKFLFEIHNGRGNNGSLLLLPLCCGSSPLLSSPRLASPRLAVIYALRGTNSRWKDARTRCRHVHGNAHDRTLSFSAIFFSSRFFFVLVLKSLHFLSVAFFPSHFFLIEGLLSLSDLRSNRDSSRALCIVLFLI